MSKSAVATRRLQVTVPATVADQVKQLADVIGVSESVAGRVLIVAGLARVGDALSNPDPVALLRSLQDAKAADQG